jgi:NAD(P)H-hydrate repair Nnr-like enzyme with NAD(P)H-hydrate epimerase domain
VSTRKIVLGVVLAMIGLFTFLTLSDAAANGVSILTVVSVIVLAMFGFGIVGALREPEE